MGGWIGGVSLATSTTGVQPPTESFPYGDVDLRLRSCFKGSFPHIRLEPGYWSSDAKLLLSVLETMDGFPSDAMKAFGAAGSLGREPSMRLT